MLQTELCWGVARGGGEGATIDEAVSKTVDISTVCSLLIHFTVTPIVKMFTLRPWNNRVTRSL